MENDASPSLNAMLSDVDSSGSDQFNSDDFSQPQEVSNPQERDDSGRFKSQEQEAQPPQAEDQIDENIETAAKVPSHRLREEAEKRRRVEDELNATRQEMQQLRAMFAQIQQPQQEPQEVDYVEKILSDPLSLIREQVRPVIEITSRRMADQSYGKEKVNEAFTALDTAIRNGQLNQSVAEYLKTQSQDPFGEIVDWYEQSMPARDPEAYKQKIIEEYEHSKQSTQNSQQAPTKNVISIPPSINKVRAAAPMQSGADLQSEDDAMSYMQSVGRK